MGDAQTPENGIITPMPRTVSPERDWKKWIRRSVYITYFTFMLLIIPILIWQLIKQGTEFEVIIWFLAGMATVFAVPISLWGILNHLIFLTRPKLQRHIFRILWMVPIYGIFSWLALSFREIAVFLNAVREGYQAYVMYNFIIYLITFLTEEYDDMDTRMKEKPQVKSPPPCCCFKAGANELIIKRCKYGVLNYVVFRPILTIVAFICELTGYYADGDLGFGLAWIWIQLLLTVSQLWAIFCLLLLYKSSRDELKSLHKPRAQFLCVQMTIFGAQFQGLIISLLVGTGVLAPNPLWEMSNADFAALVQDFIVCFEMVIAALAHAYAFSYKPYKHMGERIPFSKSLIMMFSVSDVGADVASHVKRVGRKVKRKFIKTPQDDNNGAMIETDENAVDDDDDNDDDERMVEIHENLDGECDLGTVTQINDDTCTYSANGKLREYPKTPANDSIAPRGDGGNVNTDDIVDSLGQDESALEADAMKGGGRNTKSDSFANDSDALDLGMGGACQMITMPPLPLSGPTRQMSRNGAVIDYGRDSELMEGIMSFDITSDNKDKMWVNDKNEQTKL